MTLRDALSATDKEGHPDWRIRVTAAIKLIDLGSRATEEPEPDPEVDRGVWSEDEE